MKCYKCGKVSKTKYCPDCGTRLLNEGGIILLHLKQWFKEWDKSLEADNCKYGYGAKWCPHMIRKNCFDSAARIQAIRHDDICLQETWMTQEDADKVIENTQALYQQAITRLEESA